MRVIVEALGRAFGVELSLLHVKMVGPGDDEQHEQFEHIPMDPHGTLSSQVERRSDMEDAFGQAPKGFGFRGSQG